MQTDYDAVPAVFRGVRRDPFSGLHALANIASEIGGIIYQYRFGHGEHGETRRTR
jgi:hypothetical protein